MRTPQGFDKNATRAFLRASPEPAARGRAHPRGDAKLSCESCLPRLVQTVTAVDTGFSMSRIRLICALGFVTGLLSSGCVGFNRPITLIDGLIPGESRIFISSTTTISGGLGLSAGGDPLASANLICSSAASAAGLSLSYVALISLSTSSFRSRQTVLTNPVYNFDSATSRRLVATSLSDMMNGASIALLSGVTRDETYADQTGTSVWTGTTSTGSTGATCTDWTDGANPGVKATVGTVGSLTSTWIQAVSTLGCATPKAFYCIGQR